MACLGFSHDMFNSRELAPRLVIFMNPGASEIEDQKRVKRLLILMTKEAWNEIHVIIKS